MIVVLAVAIFIAATWTGVSRNQQWQMVRCRKIDGRLSAAGRRGRGINELTANILILTFMLPVAYLGNTK